MIINTRRCESRPQHAALGRTMFHCTAKVPPDTDQADDVVGVSPGPLSCLSVSDEHGNCSGPFAAPGVRRTWNPRGNRT
jgi:hypothetical protein